jgi:hypothetical protein
MRRQLEKEYINRKKASTVPAAKATFHKQTSTSKRTEKCDRKTAILTKAPDFDSNIIATLTPSNTKKANF